MKPITDEAVLDALYGEAVPTSLTKVASRMTPLYRQWINASRFLILSTVGPEGTDASPRGDNGPVVEILDDKTLLLPDWRGNNRIDSLRNIVRDQRVSLMFLVPGCKNVVRINGTAILTTDQEVLARFERKGIGPKTVVAITISEMYFQCAKALMRSRLWTSEDESKNVPTAGMFVKEFHPDFDAVDYDTTYAKNAVTKMW